MSKCYTCGTQITETGQDASYEWKGEVVCASCYIEYADNKIAELEGEVAGCEWEKIEVKAQAFRDLLKPTASKPGTNLPECKWQRNMDNVVMCFDRRGPHWGLYHGGLCSTRCKDADSVEGVGE